jgi:hypothetical protein
MSTKNLSKTVIEGGRHNHNKYDRRTSHQETRAAERAYLDEVKADVENYYEYDIEPTRPVGKGFTDKLNPMYRWLVSQVGKPWNDVRSLITEKFDTRTTAGRHVVEDHIIKSVEVTPDVRYPNRYEDPTTSYSKYDFYVDEAGLLQQRRYLGRRSYPKIPPFDTKRLTNWLNGRIVGKVGKKLFWFTPADKSTKRGGYSHIWRTTWGPASTYYYSYYGDHGPQFEYLHYEIVYKRDSVGKPIIENGGMVEIERKETWKHYTPSLRQDRKLNDKELEFWNALPAWYQTRIMEESPTYPKELKKNKRRLY